MHKARQVNPLFSPDRALDHMTAIVRFAARRRLNVASAVGAIFPVMIVCSALDDFTATPPFADMLV